MESFIIYLIVLVPIIGYLVLRWYKKESLRLHNTNLVKARDAILENLKKSLNLNDEVIATIFEEKSSYNFNKFNGNYDHKKLSSNKISSEELITYFESREQTCLNFLNIESFDLMNIYNLIPELYNKNESFEVYATLEIHDLLKQEDLIFKDFLRNRLELYQLTKIKYLEKISVSTKDSEDFEIPDYTQDILNNVLRFIQRREKHNLILKEFKMI